MFYKIEQFSAQRFHCFEDCRFLQETQTLRDNALCLKLRKGTKRHIEKLNEFLISLSSSSFSNI